MSKTKFVSAIPLSIQAKDRFDNIMNLFHSCKIENETETMYFLTSLNGKYRFWVQKEGNEHWKIEK